MQINLYDVEKKLEKACLDYEIVTKIKTHTKTQNPKSKIKKIQKPQKHQIADKKRKH